MARPALRVALSAFIGLVVGRVLGPLFVPDPTGLLAVALTIGIAVLTSVVLYRSDWLRDGKPVP